MPNLPVILRTKSQSQFRLFCFPYAGGGASLYRLWPTYAPAELEICPVQLPGRENRIGDAPFTHLTPLVESLVQVLKPYQDLPFAFFGHSMGALISFELARQLRREGMAGPRQLFVSAHRAPQLPRRVSAIHELPDPEFIEALHKLGGTPEAVLKHEELMQMLLPVLRADFSIYGTYVYTDEAPLACPISAFGGTHDEDVSEQELVAWREQTTSSFTLTMYIGNHFFLHTYQKQLVETIALQLF